MAESVLAKAIVGGVFGILAYYLLKPKKPKPEVKKETDHPTTPF